MRIFLISFIGCVAIMPLLALPVMIGSFIDHLGYSESGAGYLYAATSLGGAACAMVLALRVHRLNLRRLAGLALSLMLICDALSIMAPTLPGAWFVALRVVSGVAGAAAYAAAMGSVACQYEPDRGFGFFIGLQFLASGLALWLLPGLLQQHETPGLMAVFALLDGVALLMLRALASAEERAGVVEEGQVEWRIIATPAAIACLLGIGLFEAANMAQYTYTERIGLDSGLDALQTGRVLGLASALGIPAGFAVYLVGSKFGVFRPLLFACCLEIAALAVWLLADGFWAYSIAACMLAVGWGVGLPYFQALEARIDAGGSVVVAGGFATAMSGFIGPAGAAALVVPGHYSRMIVAAMAVFAVTVLLARFATRRVAA